jgi:hypothetical protein
VAAFYSRALHRSNTDLREEGEREVTARRGGARARGEGIAQRGAEAEHARMVQVLAAAASHEGYAEWSLSVCRCPRCAGQGVARNMATRQASVRLHTVPMRREARQLEG